MNKTLWRAMAWALALLALLAPVVARAQAPTECPPAPPGPGSLQLDELRAQARDRGLLWRIEKGGRTSWLYGTLHLGRPQWLVPGPTVMQAIAASDTIALELDLSDPAVLAALTPTADPALTARVLDDERRERLQRQLARGCLPAAAIDAQRPFMTAMMLMVNEARRDGLFVELGSEFVLMGMAQRADKPLVGLETAAQQMALLTPASDEEERELVDGVLRDIESGESRGHLRRMADLWAVGDDTELARYPQWCQCLKTPAERRLFARLNDDRNPGMADRLAALHAGGSRVFAAVGALHMTGPQALPALMRARGFSVQRVRLDRASP